MTLCRAGEAGQIRRYFRVQTREAVAAYQRLVGLPITGVVDRETWYSLLSTYQSVLLAQPEQEWLEEFIGLPETFLVKGMRGEAVRQRSSSSTSSPAATPKCPLSR